MGLFDKVKQMAEGFVPAHQQSAVQPPQPPPPPQREEPDVAGFDPNDEAAFFNAVLHMESEGQYGGTDQSRAEICARYGIRDRGHWRAVKASVYAVLAAKYGSYDEVGQREINWRSAQMTQQMTNQVATMQAAGGFAPVEGIGLEQWAAINAAIIGGRSPEDLLNGAGIAEPRWKRASDEWNARMAKDTTFAIAQVYGKAFQAASTGAYGAYAREATAARAENRELALEPPMPYERYYEIMLEQKAAGITGGDPVAALAACGLTITDWTDLGTYYGYFFARNAVRDHAKYQAIHANVDAEMAAKYPGVLS
ncbi:MAG TPA: hypothetical protein VH143_10615 [Kofleriaceae bacterium]|jgi:hypothetical protein|nr:hypothetical protein [Kofleriaceae bacterium]